MELNSDLVGKYANEDKKELTEKHMSSSFVVTFDDAIARTHRLEEKCQQER